MVLIGTFWFFECAGSIVWTILSCDGFGIIGSRFASNGGVRITVEVIWIFDAGISGPVDSSSEVQGMLIGAMVVCMVQCRDGENLTGLGSVLTWYGTVLSTSIWLEFGGTLMLLLVVVLASWALMMAVIEFGESRF